MYFLFSVERYRLLGCRDCGHMMLHPQPSDEALAAIYGAQYALLQGGEDESKQFASIKQATSRHYLDLIGRYRGHHGGKLLEVGSGQGDLLVVAASVGYEVTGVEYSGYACEEARQKLGNSGRIIQGDLRDVVDPSEVFDVCVLADLLEHVRDPDLLLQHVYRFLAPDGVLFIATPSLDSWSAKLFKSDWMEFKAEHLHYFSKTALQTLLFNCGFHQTVALPGVKFLSPAYIFDHFKKYPVPKISSVLRCFSAITPASFQRRQFRLVASGMITISSKSSRSARYKLSIILPAYNEAPTIDTVLRSLIERDLEPLDKEIIIVESNSSDSTREVVSQYRNHSQVKLIFEDRPRGKGHAVRAGLAHATGDFVLIQDADLEYDIEDYDVLLEPLISGRSAFVLGSRHGGKTWKLRQFAGNRAASILFNFGHWFFRTVLNLLYGTHLKDPFTMYKVFRRDCLSGLRFECDYFDFDFELLIKLVRKGFIPIEIPVNYRSRSFYEGKKVSLLRDPWTWLRALVRFRFSKLDLLEVIRSTRRETR
jgi:SAM-dependent methyltransferase